METEGTLTVNNGDKTFNHIEESGSTITLIQYKDNSHLKSLEFVRENIDQTEGIIKNAVANYQNSDIFEGTIELETASRIEGTLYTKEGNDDIEIKSKFASGAPYGFAEIVKKGYKFVGLLRAFDPSKSTNQGLIDPIYGHIEMEVVDPDTNDVQIQKYAGLFSTK